MKFQIKKVKKNQHSHFSVYTHSLSMTELDDYILKILYDKEKLNYLFQKNVPLKGKERIFQLQRFIDNSFKNREHEVKVEEIKASIEDNNNPTYYSFFAEALLARLNIDYIDKDLVTKVLVLGDNLTKVSTGADVCLFSEKHLIIGEAKFYENLYKGVSSIINDKSFSSKLEDYISNLVSVDCEIILKGVEGNISAKTAEQIKQIPLVFSGFVLHSDTKTGCYNSAYQLIDNIKIKDFPSHYQVHLYHLPVKSKNELIFKAQKKAIELINLLKV